jgi:hypothetical protein
MKCRSFIVARLFGLEAVDPSLPASTMSADAQPPGMAESVGLARRVAQAICSPCEVRACNGSPNPRAPTFTTIPERYADGNPASVLMTARPFVIPGCQPSSYERAKSKGRLHSAPLAQRMRLKARQSLVHNLRSGERSSKTG